MFDQSTRENIINRINEKFNQIRDQVDYADIRIHFLDKEEHYSTLKGQLHSFEQAEKFGFGVRVLVKGSWGFSSYESLNQLDDAFDKAIILAQTSSHFQTYQIELAQKEKIIEQYQSPISTDPFTTAKKIKLERILELDRLLAHEKFNLWGTYLSLYKRDILYMDLDGSCINKLLLEINYSHSCSTIDKDGFQQKRSWNMPLDPKGTIGLENLTDQNLNIQAEKTKNELLELLDAPLCSNETCDLILLPEMMALQTHETIGHALELDRILGHELSYAGGSHVDLKDFNQLQFGSQKLTARADGTIPNSPGSYGFDDDGVPCKNVVLIEKGVLKGAITSRQMIVEANKKNGKKLFSTSGGASRSESYNKLPIERMNNINIDSGNDGSLQDIIARTTNGILVESPRSWSIGSNRENFHFACEVGWKIKNGKIVGMLRNPTYFGDSLSFWNSLEDVGDESTWQLQQVFNCGKGQPNQIMRLGHGIPICRFSNVKVGNS